MVSGGRHPDPPFILPGKPKRYDKSQGRNEWRWCDPSSLIFDDKTTHQIYETSLTAPQGTSLQGNNAEVIVETPESINSSNQVIQPLLSDLLYLPIVFQDVSAIYSNGLAASLSSAQSIGMWTNDVPGSDGSYVQEAYGSIWPAFQCSHGDRGSRRPALPRRARAACWRDRAKLFLIARWIRLNRAQEKP